jgi:predicted Zn finger-like uncharacterized protein
MIVVCPSCATRQEVQENHLVHGKAVVRCLACRRTWIERTQLPMIEAIACETLHDSRPVSEAEAIDEPENNFDAEREALRVAQAARAAEQKYLSHRRRRAQARRGWLVLAAAVMVPVVVLLLLPHQVARAFPPALRLYAVAGLDINPRGLEFRNVGQQHLLTDNVRVLAIQGEIVNISGREQPIPMIRFTLRDSQGAAIYEWSLKAVSRPIKAEEVSSFLTRVASPPENAEAIEIRFAEPQDSGTTH